MLTDRQIEYLTLSLQDIYSQIEIELIVSVATRLANYRTISGTLEWHLRKLSELKVLNKDLVKILAKYSGITEKAILTMFDKARMANIDLDYLKAAHEAGATSVTYESLRGSEELQRIMDSSVYNLKSNLSMINTTALESAKTGYIRALEKAYVEAATGTYGLQEAVQRSVRELAQKGLTGATYESGRKISLEAAVRRDALSAVGHQVNDGALAGARQMGTNYVETSQHLGARVSTKSKIANHAGWQGKVFQIEGSSPEYGNLVEETGYGSIEGLGGVNCRHRIFPFFPGISRPKEPVDTQRNREVYAASQKQRALERKWKATKREAEAAKAAGDPETAKKLKKKCLEISKEIEDLRKEFPELSGSGNRVLTWEEIAK